MTLQDSVVRESVEAVASGKQTSSELLPLVYDQLVGRARALMNRQKPGQTLQATALVHEAYLRVVGIDDPAWYGQKHFFRAAAKAMRNILIDIARRKSAEINGGDKRRVEIDSSIDGEILYDPVTQDENILDLDQALNLLESHDPRAAEVVELRYFAGLPVEEIAKVLDVSASTVERDWRFARSYLKRLLNSDK